MPQRRVVHLLPAQDRFIFSRAQFTCFAGGWGCGKTMAGCIALYKRAVAMPGSRWLIGRHDFTALRDTTLQDWLDLFSSKGRYVKDEHNFYLPNGSVVHFRHLDDIRKLTNINLTGFWIDQAEEVSEEIFTYLRGRGRRQSEGEGQRQGFLTCNMEGHNWIWRMWKNQKTRLPGTELVEATTYDNQANLPSDFLKQLETLPELAKKRYVLASWDAFEGQVFDEFDERVHVIDPFTIPPEWARYESIDHGYTNPTAVLWWAVDYDGNVYAYDEHYASKKLIPEHAQAILARRRRSDFGGSNQTIQATYIDPSTNAENVEYKGTLTSIQKLYAAVSQQRIVPLPGANDKAAGINLIKQFLKPDPSRFNTRTNQKGAPRLYFFRNCVNLIDEVRSYAWKRLRPHQEGKQNVPEEPVKVNDHAIDSMKYFLLSFFGATERPVPEKPQNIGELVRRDLDRVEQREQAEEFDFDLA